MMLRGLLVVLPIFIGSCGDNIGSVPSTSPAPRTIKSLGLEGLYFPAVYFEAGQSDISERQKLYLDDMGLRFREAGVMHLALTGHSDSSGNDLANKILSEKRAESVAAELMKLGYRRDDLLVLGVGSSRPRFPDPNQPDPRGERFVLLQSRD